MKNIDTGQPQKNTEFPNNRRFKIVTDILGNVLDVSSGLVSLGHHRKISTMNDVYEMICDGENGEYSYQAKIVEAIDNLIRNFLQNFKHWQSHFGMFYYVLDFTIELYNGNVIVVNRFSQPGLDEHNNLSGFVHMHDYYLNRHKQFSPSIIEIVVEKVAISQDLESILLDQIGKVLSSVLPITKSEYEVIQSYLQVIRVLDKKYKKVKYLEKYAKEIKKAYELKSLSKDIADLINNKRMAEKSLKNPKLVQPATIIEHRKNIIHKLSQIAPNLDKWEKIIDFLQDYKVLKPLMDT